MIDRELVKREFKSYVSGYDINDDKIKLKVLHTYKVASNCENIATSLDLSSSDVDLAWLIGMLHDIGRFEQLRRFHTFIDKDSIDHAKFGADLLFNEGLIDRFKVDGKLYPVIESAIRFHNYFVLPCDIDERTLLFAKIIRDADKTDIFRVAVEFSAAVVYDTTEEALKDASISDEVLDASLKHLTVDKEIRKSPVDYIVSHISLVYGLYFPVSLKVVKDQGFLQKVMDFRNDNPQTNERMKLISDEVNRYIEECG